MKTKKIVFVAIMISLGTILSILESFIPTGIPGVKIGLANIVTLIVLYLYSEKEAIIVQILRILLVGLIYSGLFSQGFLLSLSGGILSIALMIIFKKITKFSIYTVSVSGSIGHSVGQILFSIIILSTDKVLLYLPIILALSIPSGFLTAALSSLVLKRYNTNLIKPKLIPLITLTIFFFVSVSLSILFSTYKKSSDEGTIATIKYQNKDIMEIPLSDPYMYKILNDDNLIKGVDFSQDSAVFTFYFFNKDDKEYYDFVVEVKDEKIRIKEETSKRHLCKNIGFISSKYESLICLPNTVIISLSDLKLEEIDARM